MKIYFTESYFMDYSRVGYDSFSITYSLTCSGSEKGSSYSSRWYFLEIDDCFTEEEANHLASEACDLSINKGITVREALKELETKALKKRKSN